MDTDIREKYSFQIPFDFLLDNDENEKEGKQLNFSGKISKAKDDAKKAAVKSKKRSGKHLFGLLNSFQFPPFQ